MTGRPVTDPPRAFGDGTPAAGAPPAGRQLWRRVRDQRVTRWSAFALCALVAVALGADCLASDLPVILKLRGELYVLPNVTRPGALRRSDNQSLAQALGPSDWALYPLVRFGPQQTQPGGRLDVLAPPGAAHWLGTDDVGRDVFAGLVHGARVAILVGLLSVLLSLGIGLVLGALGGYLRGPVDGLVTWVVAVMMTFPTFLLVLVVQGLVRAQSLWGLALVLGLTGFTGVARLVRGEVLRAVSLPHVEAARALGASHARLLAHHVLPAAIGPVVVASTFGVASAILVESGLSFLGLGPDVASWGRLLSIALSNRDAWWLALFPGVAISATVLATNFFAEGLQDALDPRHAIAPRPRPGLLGRALASLRRRPAPRPDAP